MYAVFFKTSPLFCSSIFTFSLLGIPLVAGQTGVIPFMAMLMPVWISSSVIFSEMHESYGFLRTVPVTDREVVKAKFLLTLLAVSVYWTATMLFALRFGIGTPQLRPNLALVLLGAVCSLIAAACWYIGIWLFGITVMTVVVLASIGIMLIGSVALRIGSARSAWFLAHDFLIVRILSESPWYVWCLLALLGLAVFYLLWLAAVRVKERSECHA